MVSSSQSLMHPYFIDFSDLYKRAHDIAHAYQSGNLVFFLGAGASRANNKSMSSWKELLDKLSKRLQFDNKMSRQEIGKLIEQGHYTLAAEAIREYMKASQQDKHRSVDEAVAKLLRQKQMKREEKDRENPALHLAILNFGAPIFTTNFDTVIEDIIAEYKLAPDYPRYTYQDENDAENLLDPTKDQDKYLFKLHGSIHKSQRLIFDEQDYADFYFYAKWPASLQLLRYILASKMVVFIGFSLSDPEFMSILREATRYAGSYQHIAFLEKSETSPIERKMLQQTYKVDPILYDDHCQLPHYVMEMRTFFPRENIALQLKASLPALEKAVADIKRTQNIPEICSTLLFGSFAKYGCLEEPKNDIDLLFLIEGKCPHKHVKSLPKCLDRNLNVTFMPRAEFAAQLRKGDTFACSVLVTGCALEDADDYFRTFARGFRGRYSYEIMLQSAQSRYGEHWQRLYTNHNADAGTYLKACHHWSLALMQLHILKDGNFVQIDEPDSLLELSLLGNFRYTINRFVAIFEQADEEFILKLMRGAKGVPLDNVDDYRIHKIVPRFIEIFTHTHLQQINFAEVVEAYNRLLEGTSDECPQNQIKQARNCLPEEIRHLLPLMQDKKV